MLKIINIVGTRPNFIKIAPLIKEMLKHPQIKQVLVHTGQHYDKEMSKLFFDDLKIPKPDINLGIGPLPNQTDKIKAELEKVFQKEKLDLVVVVGDVNSTLAASLAAANCKIKVAHIEAGLRSFDMTMPRK